MKKSILSVFVCAMLISCGSTGSVAVKESAETKSDVQVISVNDAADGWASYTGTKDLSGASVVPPSSRKGTTGGAGGTVYVVKNRAELMAAASKKEKKVIYVEGVIDMTDTGSGTMIPSVVTGSTPVLDKFIADNTAGSVLPCANYKEWKEKYTGSFKYSEDQNGPVALLRDTINTKYRGIIELNVSSDTTIIGADENAQIIGGAVAIHKVKNVVVRNLKISDCYNPFPAVEEDDGLNADFDGITVRGSKYVWIDHCTLTTRFTPEDIATDHYNTKDGESVKWQVYDGLLDIVAANDFVTVSWCVLSNHDKTMLMGNSDKATADKNHQTVTLHHNQFDSCVQRLPMVRYATLHIYNNVYTNQKKYGIDCRKDSRIYSECNSFEKEINSRTANKKGDFYDTGSVNLNRKDLDAKPVWNPSDYYKYKAQSADAAKKAVLANAGSGKLKVVR